MVEGVEGVGDGVFGDDDFVSELVEGGVSGDVVVVGELAARDGVGEELGGGVDVEVVSFVEMVCDVGVEENRAEWFVQGLK